MGWSFRKYAKLGPFRLNFSKSGISASFGIKGLRISAGRRGTFVSLGSNGIYYRQKISNKGTYNRVQNIRPPDDLVESDLQPHTITTADLDNVTDVDSQAFINELESKAKKRPLFKILGLWPSIILIAYSFINSREQAKVDDQYKEVFQITKKSVLIRDLPSKQGAILYKARQGHILEVAGKDTLGWQKVYLTDSKVNFGYVRGNLGKLRKQLKKRGYISSTIRKEFLIDNIILFIGLTMWCVALYKNDLRRKTLEIYYSVDREIEALHKKFLEFFREFADSDKVWQKLHKRNVHDTKYHAGALQLVSRAPVLGVYLSKNPLPHFKTNISIPAIILRNTEIYFFPERIILKREHEFGTVPYKNLKITKSDVRFIEQEIVPADATIVDHTWKYLNKNGDPDMRFNYNPRIPICRYTDYEFESDSGLNEVITTSKRNGMDKFTEFIKVIGVST
ncbi:DUF4236 domain-containing protein [Fulvivirgaceae bacterium PWU4]|uniref:DUF4236 domain-containing protein n=1 Tax=Chryseosolibacter histidini TaxID=2782349 RepID=A0AAP2DH80_9BACT|nr:DUF4236 domain-containing protein [Chryseosolibacter histidini]MBT1696180.1 DUF4236 domain-containing protein [Chryseosolibacter histidini]